MDVPVVSALTVFISSHSDYFKQIALKHATDGFNILLISKNASVVELSHEIQKNGVECNYLQMPNEDEESVMNIISFLFQNEKNVNRFFLSPDLLKKESIIEKIILKIHQAGMGAIYFLKEEGNFIPPSLQKFASYKNVQFIAY